MGDMADYYREQQFDFDIANQEYDEYYNNVHYKDILSEYLKNKLYWFSKDNQQILIKDMTDSHILNSIKWIDKHHSDRTVMQELKDILIMEKIKRNI